MSDYRVPAPFGGIEIRRSGHSASDGPQEVVQVHPEIALKRKHGPGIPGVPLLSRRRTGEQHRQQRTGEANPFERLHRSQS
jgi:hypothetical protein